MSDKIVQHCFGFKRKYSDENIALGSNENVQMKICCIALDSSEHIQMKICSIALDSNDQGILVWALCSARRVGGPIIWYEVGKTKSLSEIQWMSSQVVKQIRDSNDQNV